MNFNYHNNNINDYNTTSLFLYHHQLPSITHALYGVNVSLFIDFIFFLDDEEIAEFGTYVTAGDDDDEGGQSLLRVYEIERNNALSNS